MIKKIISKAVPQHIRNQAYNFFILSKKYGQYKSIKNFTCIDRNNNEIPWYTYPTIEYLNNIDFSKKNIFEYGSGNSTIYWCTKAKHVTSIEHNQEWYNEIKSKIKNNNLSLIFKNDNSEYEESIKTIPEKYDVIIIDGIRRPECSKIIESYLNIKSNEGYMVLLDNSDWYKETSKYLREKLDLIEVDFHGFGPINAYTWTTSIFLSRNFKFKPLDEKQPIFSISAIEHNGELQ